MGIQGSVEGKASMSSLAPYYFSWPIGHRLGILLPPESRVGLRTPGSADTQRQVRRGWASGVSCLLHWGMCCRDQDTALTSAQTAQVSRQQVASHCHPCPCSSPPCIKVTWRAATSGHEATFFSDLSLSGSHDSQDALATCLCPELCAQQTS